MTTSNQPQSLEHAVRSRVKNEVKWMKVLHLNMAITVGDVSLHMYEVML